ncbi:hypothetical protein JTB14_020765 [Gonioctena quinquepunctata]|nr:hypothetical protein JTB14_020765 [Gonioctena quinquepunctata]
MEGNLFSDQKYFSIHLSILWCSREIKIMSDQNNNNVYSNKKEEYEMNFLEENFLENEIDFSVKIEKIVQGENSEIYSLKKLLEKPCNTSETKSTQTVKNSKIASTQSTIFTREATVQTIDISNVTDYPAETKKKEAAKIVGAISKASPDVKISEFNPTPKILILCNELGYGLGKSISKFIGNEFSIETLIKPGAYFVNVIEDIINLSTNFGLNDYIIVLAGSNDFHAKKFPLFREINSKAKCSSHTNIIFSSVGETGINCNRCQL